MTAGNNPLTQPDAAVPAAESPFPSTSPPGRSRETRYGWLALVIVWTTSAIYLWVNLRQGWIPHDPGTLGQMAEWVLHGRLPHVNFIEVYTGGLDYLNALAFRLFGANFFSLRIPLFFFFLGWVPSLYFIARRFVRPFTAGVITLLAVAWSVPNYPEAMPSWYNLFFATWGVLALLRYTETDRRRWLWLAGLCGGLSFLAKISGLYFVAAGLLFLVFREQSSSQGEPGDLRHRTQAYRLFVTSGLALFLLVLVSLISQRPTASEFFQFAVPLSCLVAFLLWETWTQPSSRNTVSRFRCLFATLLPFLAGVLLPVAVFLAQFAARGALRAFFDGVFFRQVLRTSWEGHNAIGPAGLGGLLPAGYVLYLASDPHRSIRKLARYSVPLLLACMLLAAWKWVTVYAFFAYSLPLLVPVLAFAVLFRLRRSAATSEISRQQAFLVVVTAAACALIQFPFSVAIYFEYAAPLVILAVIALLPRGRRGEPVAVGSILAFYLVFAVWLHPPTFYIGMGTPTRQPFHLRTLALPRGGGLRVPGNLASEFQTLISAVQRHARGRYIYAAPDCPEVYFLSGLRNPTGTVLDALDPDFLNPVGRATRILGELKRRDVNTVVICPGDSSFSGDISPGLHSLLDARYPHSANVGKFQMRWRK